MTVPIELVLVRHGQSEGNVAQHHSRKGDSSHYTEEFRRRHSSSWRLTDKGVMQAKAAGERLKAQFPAGFDRYYVSAYIRAMETAGLLDLPGADWLIDIYLRERDGGELEPLPEDERCEQFAQSLELREAEPFFWTPPNGESVASICARVDRVLDTMHRECSDKRVVMVLHGEMMWAFRVRLERMSSRRYRELHLSRDPKDRLYNCQILHYTRRDPATGKLHNTFGWMMSVNPVDPTTSRNEWEPILRPRYTNEDLLDRVSQTPRVISGG